MFENFRDKCIETYRLDPAQFLSAPGQAWQACLKKTEVKLELLTESSFLIYDDTNNLYGFPMCKKLPVSGFKWADNLSIFTKDFIKNYDEEDDTGYLFVVDVEYPKNLHKLHSDLPFLPERMKINKCDKLVCNLNDKENYPVHVLALKQALNHGLKLTKVHSVISFRQEYWLKPYIDLNTDLRKDAKNDFEKDFFKLMNNSVFGKAMENVRSHRNIRVVTTDRRRNILASEPNYLSTKYISKDLLIMEMRKVEARMNKPIHLGQAILDIRPLCINFGMIRLNPSMQIKQDYATWIQIALSCTLKLKIFTKILLMMLKGGLIH